MTSERQERLWDWISIGSVFAVILWFVFHAAALAQDEKYRATIAPPFQAVTPRIVTPPCPPLPLDVIR